MGTLAMSLQFLSGIKGLMTDFTVVSILRILIHFHLPTPHFIIQALQLRSTNEMLKQKEGLLRFFPDDNFHGIVWRLDWSGISGSRNMDRMKRTVNRPHCQRFAARLHYASTLDDAYEHSDDGQHQQDVNKSTESVRTHHSQEPENY